MSVSLVWITPGADDLVAYLARVSAPENQARTENAERLIRYLIKHQHWSPFEMVDACMEIVVPRDIGRQLLRHRSMFFQEFSQRYSEVTKLPAAKPREARLQDPKNRQASLPCDNERKTRVWRETQEEVQRISGEAYAWALSEGIAKEVARSVLPEGITNSRLYMKGSLRSWLHFCSVRRGNGTQKETSDIAEAAWGILRHHCPKTVTAWESIEAERVDELARLRAENEALRTELHQRATGLEFRGG